MFATGLRRLLACLVLIPYTAAADPPDGAELEFLWQVNLARSDPGAWGHANGLGTLLDAIPPKQPLSRNATLVDSAQAKAQEFVDHAYFSHESPVTGWPNHLIINVFGYPLAGGSPFFYFGPGCDFGCSYAPSTLNSAVESLAGGGSPIDTPLGAVRALLGEICGQGDVINSCGTDGHRKHLLAAATTPAPMVESGAGHAIRITQEIGGPFETHYWVFHTGFPASSPATMPQFLTGVVYADGDGDRHYDAGEGLGGVTVQANALQAVTNAAGDWSLSVPNASYDVTCSGGGFAGTSSATDVVVADANREVDCLSGVAQAAVDFVPEPTSFAAGSAALAALAWIARRARS
jgi:hypothetical protein